MKLEKFLLVLGMLNLAGLLILTYLFVRQNRVISVATMVNAAAVADAPAQAGRATVNRRAEVVPVRAAPAPGMETLDKRWFHCRSAGDCTVVMDPCMPLPLAVSRRYASRVKRALRDVHDTGGRKCPPLPKVPQMATDCSADTCVIQPPRPGR